MMPANQRAAVNTSIKASIKASVHAAPLTAAAFVRFGQVLEAGGDAASANQGRAARHDLEADIGFADARATRLHTAIYRIRQSALPCTLTVIERHRLSPQLFFPNSGARFLVCACPALDDGEPDLDSLQAFIGQHAQGIVWRAGVWHSPFAALDADGDFLMQQWQCGGADDCEERYVESPITINASPCEIFETGDANRELTLAELEGDLSGADTSPLPAGQTSVRGNIKALPDKKLRAKHNR